MGSAGWILNYPGLYLDSVTRWCSVPHACPSPYTVVCPLVYPGADCQGRGESGDAKHFILRRERSNSSAVGGNDCLAGEATDQNGHVFLRNSGGCRRCLPVADVRVFPGELILYLQ